MAFATATNSSRQAKGEKREAAILFVDIRSFSPMAAKMDASDVMQTLSRYQSRVVPIIQDCGGVIDKFMGDGIMATFSNDGEGAAGSARALEAAERILTDVEQWSDADPELAAIKTSGIGIGIASGPVAFGAVGQENRLEMTMIGSAVNYSAKLEKHNKKLGSRLIVSAGTYQEAVARGYRGRLQPDFLTEPVEGTSEPQDIVVLSLPRTGGAPPLDPGPDFAERPA